MKSSISNISIFKKGLLLILIISSFLELILFPEWDNFVGCVVSILSTLLFYNYVLKIDVIRNRPISFIVILHLFLFMYLPLPATLIDGNELSHDMYNPILTYILQFIYYSITLIAFIWAGRIKNKHKGLNKVLKKIGYFDAPSVKQMWALGIFGWVFKLATLNIQYSSDDVYVSGMGTLSMFAIFIYTPILILFQPLLGKSPCTKKERILVYTYIIFMTIVLVATNSRSQILSPFILYLFCYLLTKIYEHQNKIWLTTRKIIIGIIGLLLVTGPLSDMAFAMLVTRSTRNDISYMELLEQTFDVYSDKERLNAYKNILESSSNTTYTSSLAWNESYVSNIFLQRLCNYRVVDATIYHAGRSGYANKEMIDDFIVHLQTIFPQKVVNFLFGNIDKSKYAYSPMDKLYAISYGGNIHVSYIVGGDVGLGLATFGFLYFPICLIVYLTMFLLFENLVLFNNKKYIFSFFVLLNIYYAYFLRLQVGGGMINTVFFVFWGFFYNTLFYLLSYKLIRIIK